MKIKAIVLATATTFGLVAMPAIGVADDKATNKTAIEKTGDYLSDAAITTKIKAALIAEEDLKSTGIDVETSAGVVTLSGAVSSDASVALAENVTRDITGVKDVHNKLEVAAN